VAQFKIGDRVKWKSAANGSWKDKEGVVERVCPPNYRPDDLIAGCGGSRDHESYVIRTSKRSGDKGKLYWPIANKLKAVP
jgi:hypothetical protein